MLKVIGFNGSPRKGWNTDQLLHKALEGARDAGATTKCYQLSDLKIHPCASCYMCKRGPKFTGKCSIKDDLTPILEEVKKADALIFATPIYFGLPSALLHNTLERLWYSHTRFTKDRASGFPRTTNIGMIYNVSY